MPRVVRLIGSAFGLGLLPCAPGTWGTLAGVGIAVGAWRLGDADVAILVILAVVTLAGVPLARAAERAGPKDPGWFVLDEVAGYLVAVLGHAPLTWTKIGAAFLLFRVFDIAKPWPVRRAEAVPGGWGVMLDDLLAGAFAHAALYLL